MAATDLYKLVVYRRSDDRELVPLVSPTTQLGANSIGSALAVAIGFDFRFDGVTYTAIDLFAYGFARLAGTETSATNSNLFAANTNILIAPWWDNIETADTVGYIKTELQGAAPERRFVIEWYVNLQAGQTASDYDRAKVQVVLYETWDQIDFRYGAIESAGAPSRASYGASCGVKGDTSVVADNFIDFHADVRPLGGNNTLPYWGLAAPTDWPAATIVTEPAWPMCGRAFLLDADELAGLQDPYAEPARRIANFTNWLIARHCPALVNISPWQETMYASVDYVVPVVPSVDGLTYDVYVQTYTTAGGDLRISIDKDIGTWPSPTNDSIWNNIALVDALGTSSGWREWSVFQITPDVTTRFLRITASHEGGGNVLLGSVLVVPQQLADIDEAASYASGAVPMCLGQIRQQGAAVHPEFYNRAWRTIRSVLLDRKQMLWSSIWPDGSLKNIEGTTARPQRRVAISPASISGWPGERVTVRSVAAAELLGATMTVAEDGGSSVQVDVSLSSTGYTLVEQELELVSDEPVIVVEGDTAGGELYPIAIVVEWAPDLGDGDLILGVTPAPRLEYYVRLAARMERALRAYAMTGLATALCRGKSTTNATRVQWQIPPAVKSLRPKIARVTADTTQTGDASSMYAATSGLGANDQVVIPSPFGRGRDDYPPEGAYTVIAGAGVFDAAPAAAMDRMLESPTAGSMTGPARERIEVLRGSGMTLSPARDDAAEL